MKILLSVISIFMFCTSYSSANTNHSNLIVNSELISNNFSIINKDDYILIPLENFLNKIKISYKILNNDNEKINIEFLNNKLELFFNSHDAYINEKFVHLVTPTIFENNQIYISTNLINDLTNFYIQYDKLSNSLFVTNKNDFKKLNFFFNKVENILKTFNSINIDVITEIIGSDNSSYSIGNNIYIDRTLNKIFQKNMLANNWEETNIKISNISDNNFNNNFFAGISVDRINSSNDYIIFNGYYPLDNNRICKSKLYVNPHSLKIEKQISEFDFEGNKVKQTVFYSYN